MVFLKPCYDVLWWEDENAFFSCLYWKLIVPVYYINQSLLCPSIDVEDDYKPLKPSELSQSIILTPGLLYYWFSLQVFDLPILAQKNCVNWLCTVLENNDASPCQLLRKTSSICSYIITNNELFCMKKVYCFPSLTFLSHFCLHFLCNIPKHAEAATRGVLWRRVFLEISQNSQENACARVSSLIKLQGLGLQLY